MSSGLIPAHAGKTKKGVRSSELGGAHPRSRGENPSAARPAKASGGSSPLTRGKQGIGLQSEEELGLIPAHAGKTMSPGTTRPRPRAHPRSRGENALGITTCTPAPGSSPLTRGKHHVYAYV